MSDPAEDFGDFMAEMGRVKVAPWTAPAKATPLADILAMKEHAAPHGIPLDSPESFPGVVELRTADGEYAGMGRIEPDGRIIIPGG